MPFGMVYLLSLAWGHPMLVAACLVYGLSVTGLFSASAYYHSTKRTEDDRTVWRTLDHISIYFMIAGTYTPMAVMGLPRGWMIAVLSIQWGLTLIGLVTRLVSHTPPRWLHVGPYVAMGWVAVLALKPLYDNLPLEPFLQMFIGGVIYSVGAVIYARKKPDPVPGVFGFHEIFHVLILVAALVHFWMVVNTLRAIVG